MSDYQELRLFLSGLTSNCEIPNPDSVVTQFFIIYNFWPIFLGYVMFGLTLVKCDYIFLLLTATNFTDNWVNYVLRSWVGTSSNYQPETCPLIPEQMPALAAERISVLYTVIWFLATFTYPTRMGKSNILFLNFSSVLALYSRCYLGFSTPVQMFAGTGAGVVEGLILSLLFYFLKVHDYDKKIEYLLQYWYALFSENLSQYPLLYMGEPYRVKILVTDESNTKLTRCYHLSHDDLVAASRIQPTLRVLMEPATFVVTREKCT